MSIQSTFTIRIDRPVSLTEAETAFKENRHLQISDEAASRIQRCRRYLDQRLSQSTDALYGINTGFGALCDTSIPIGDLQQLQINLVRSHAVGAGELVPPELVRLMMLLKIQSLSYGHSGISLQVVERLIDMYNAGVFPVLYQIGSLGASGDLAPLAHLSLPLLGEGEVWYKGERFLSKDVLAQLDWPPIKLQSKEGLALLNGTQFSTAYTLWAVWQAERLLDWAQATAALSLEGFNGRYAPFSAQLHAVRPHSGQVETAEAMRKWLEGSEIGQQPAPSVQDPYAFRCVPQVHGASAMAIRHAAEVVGTEINSVTDNPTIFPEEDLILSGGNFHAQPIALVADYLAIALAELGSISERRCFQLLNGERGLPAFLTPEPGLSSGLMIAQYTAAALASQNKQLCTPASVDSIVSSNGQEDHVSMAANAATKLYRVVKNTENLLAIEWMTAAQAVTMRRPLKTSPALSRVVDAYREIIPELTTDRILQPDIEKTVAFMKHDPTFYG